MANSTLVALPTGITSFDEIQRVLARVIEELDVLLGNRGTDPALRASELINASSTLNQLTADLNVLAIEARALEQTIQRAVLTLNQSMSITDDQILAMQQQVDNLASSLSDLNDTLDVTNNIVSTLQGYWTSKTLSADYYDFAFIGWDSLTGNGEFIALGSDLVNAPFTPNALLNYSIYVYALPSVAGEAILRMIVLEDGVNTYNLTKAGGSWS